MEVSPGRTTTRSGGASGSRALLRGVGRGSPRGICRHLRLCVPGVSVWHVSVCLCVCLHLCVPGLCAWCLGVCVCLCLCVPGVSACIVSRGVCVCVCERRGTWGQGLTKAQLAGVVSTLCRPRAGTILQIKNTNSPSLILPKK